MANRQGISAYVSGIWKCRYFWLSLVRMDLRTRYRRSVLGIGWSLLHPLAMTAVVCTVFSQVFNLEITEYGPFVLSGLAFWGFINNVIQDGCSCLFLGESYIRQHPAPIAIYPLRATLGASFHFLVSLAVVVFLTWCFKGLVNPSALFSLLPSMALLFLLGWSLAVVAGFATVYFPDVQHLLVVALQILFYATPIIYPATMVKGSLAGLVQYNPLTAIVLLVRDPILAGQVPGPETFALAGLTLLVALAAAAWCLGRLQRRLIFHL